jgi:pimeloyl-ACP methyl ester carboxylesterase
VNYPWPQTPDAFERQVETIAAFDIRDRLKNIRIPTLALHGERDMLFPPERVLPELTAISGLKMTIIPGAATPSPWMLPSSSCGGLFLLGA